MASTKPGLVPNLYAIELPNTPSWTITSGVTAKIIDCNGAQTIQVNHGGKLIWNAADGENTIQFLVNENGEFWDTALMTVYRYGTTLVLKENGIEVANISTAAAKQFLDFDLGDSDPGFALTNDGSIKLNGITISTDEKKLSDIIGLNNYDQFIDFNGPTILDGPARILDNTLMFYVFDNSKIDATHLPKSSAFNVTFDGKSIEVKSVSIGDVSVIETGEIDDNGSFIKQYRTVIRLKLAEKVLSGQQVLISYQDPTINNDEFAIQDRLGNDMDGFVQYGVINNSPDLIPPVPLSASLFHDNGVSSTDNITSDPTILLKKFEWGASIKYSLNGTGWYSANWTWSPANINVDVDVLFTPYDLGEDGAKTIYIKQIDPSGNESNTTKIDFTLDTAEFSSHTKQEAWSLVTPGIKGLYFSDGSTAGTTKFPVNFDTWQGPGQAGIVSNENKTKVFFSSLENGGLSYNLFSTDGSISGTHLIQTLAYNGFQNSLLKLNNDRIAFMVDSNTLLVSDGTTSIKSSLDISPLQNNNLFSIIQDKAHGNYWFVASSVPYGNELGLLKIGVDGKATSSIVKDISPGSSSSIGSRMYNYALLSSGQLVFSASSSGNYYSYNELWVSDGTVEGTIKIQDHITNLNGLTAFGNKVFFNTGKDLGVTDGTVVNTHLIFESIYTDIKILKVTSDAVYFTGSNIVDGVTKTSLFSTDGNKSEKIADITGSANFLTTTQNGNAFFIVNDQTLGEELWIANKADNSFHNVKDILPGSGSAMAQTGLVTVAGNKILFSAYVNATSQAYFISDGSDAGTFKISDDVPTSSYLIGSTLIFSNKTGVYSVDTSAVTPSIFNLNLAPIASPIGHDADQLFFKTANNEFYVANAQSVLKLASNVAQFRVLEENTVYFTETQPNYSNKLSLWFSDATETGTHFVGFVDSSVNLEVATAIHTVGVNYQI